MTHVQELVRNVLDTQFDNFKPATVDYARARIIETVGAIIGGVNSSRSRYDVRPGKRMGR